MFTGVIESKSHEGGFLVSFTGSSPALESIIINAESGIYIGKVDAVLGNTNAPLAHVAHIDRKLDLDALIGVEVGIRAKKQREERGRGSERDGRRDDRRGGRDDRGYQSRDRQGGRFERNDRGRGDNRGGGDWDCPKCQNSNFAFRTECNRCGEPKGHGGAVDEAMTVEVAETIVEEAETTEVTEADAVEKSTTITTGIVQNAKTQISHSGMNATDAENLVPVAEAVVEAMTEEVAETIEIEAVTAVTKVETDKVDALREEEAVVTKTVAMVIGTVPNVRILISPSEQNATDAVHHVVEAEGVDLVETLENERLNAIPVIDLPEESFQNDLREERVIDLHAGMDATAAMNGEVRIEVRTIKIALEAMIDQQNANHVNLEPSENHEETVRVMPTTDLLNH